MAEGTGCDVLRPVAGAAAEPAIRRSGARQAGIPRAVAQARPGSHRRGSVAELAGSSAAALGVNLALAPDGVSTHTSPTRHFQERQKFRQRPFIIHPTGEAADRMCLAGTAAAALGMD